VPATRTDDLLIRAKAPLRISFAGGGTDVPPFPQQEGGLVLNATINRYAHGTLRPTADGQVRIRSVDLGTETSFPAGEPMVFDGNLDLVKAAIRKMGSGAGSGFELFLRSDAPPGSGLGASSALVVALVGLFRELQHLPLTDYELAELAFLVERRDFGVVGGSQDQYAAAFGGFNFLEFEEDRVIVNPLRVRSDTVLELEDNLLLCYTGATRRSDHIIEDQTSRYRRKDAGTSTGLHEQKRLAVEMKNALLQHRLREFGDLLDRAWQAKKRMSERISTPQIDELYEEARRHGALGGKVIGAGGGGYLMLYCDYRSRHGVAEAVARMGAGVDEVAFEQNGLRTWRVDASR
jgi:D-glycero-alpha-D-manno-heptose-7-phosphate kinase